MGLFRDIKKQHAANAKWAAEKAKENQREARKIGQQIAKVNADERRSLNKDPDAVRAIVRDLEVNQRIARLNARDLQRMAQQSEKAAKRWF
jgi:methyl coenzyme M reductase subunit C-like uncharacterized protein (methanogenesis marker protein 7)